MNLSPTEAFQLSRGIPATEGRVPLTSDTGERGANLLVPEPCLTSHTGDRGSGHEAVAPPPQNRDLGSDPSRADTHTVYPDTEDVVPPKSRVKTGLTGSGLPALSLSPGYSCWTQPSPA